MPDEPQYPCRDCGGDGYGPMFTKATWSAAWGGDPPRNADHYPESRPVFLCEPCVGVRLGRPLSDSDFIDCGLTCMTRLTRPADDIDPVSNILQDNTSVKETANESPFIPRRHGVPHPPVYVDFHAHDLLDDGTSGKSPFGQA